MAILTNLDAEEYQIDEDKIEVYNGLVIANITIMIMDKVIYVTNLHLHPMLEMIRMKEIQNIKNILRAPFTRGSDQVWAGSFNSLCEEEWGMLGRRRRENNLLFKHLQNRQNIKKRVLEASRFLASLQRADFKFILVLDVVLDVVPKIIVHNN